MSHQELEVINQDCLDWLESLEEARDVQTWLEGEPQFNINHQSSSHDPLLEGNTEQIVLQLLQECSNEATTNWTPVCSPLTEISTESDTNIDLLPGAQASPKETCKVCSKPGKVQKFYGGRCCNSCRAFFKRSVMTDAHLEFQCKVGFSGACFIDSRSWKSCRACRFQACCNAGMMPEMVFKKPSKDSSTLARPKSTAIVNNPNLIIKSVWRPQILIHLSGKDQDFLRGQVNG